jgi:hypothetical protein
MYNSLVQWLFLSFFPNTRLRKWPRQHHYITQYAYSSQPTNRILHSATEPPGGALRNTHSMKNTEQWEGNRPDTSLVNLYGLPSLPIFFFQPCSILSPPHPLLVPWSWKSRAITLLPLWAVRPVQSLSACTRVHFTFTFYLHCHRLRGRRLACLKSVTNIQICLRCCAFYCSSNVSAWPDALFSITYTVSESDFRKLTRQKRQKVSNRAGASRRKK